MDVNGTPYFLLREPAEFAHGSSAFGWDARRGAFTLRQAQQLRLPQVPVAAARAAWAGAGALVRDPFGQVARVAPGSELPADTGTGLQRDHVVVAAGLGFAPLRDDALRPVAAPRGWSTSRSAARPTMRGWWSAIVTAPPATG